MVCNARMAASDRSTLRRSKRRTFMGRLPSDRAKRMAACPHRQASVVPSRRAPAVGLAALTLGACVSARENGKGFDAGARRRLVVNWTTRREVEAMLGKPKAKTPGADGEETWVYEHTTVWAVDYPVPFWRPMSIGQTPRDLLTVRFTYGVVTGCSFARERYRTRDGRIVATDATTEECAK